MELVTSTIERQSQALLEPVGLFLAESGHWRERKTAPRASLMFCILLRYKPQMSFSSWHNHIDPGQFSYHTVQWLKKKTTTETGTVGCEPILPLKAMYEGKGLVTSDCGQCIWWYLSHGPVCKVTLWCCWMDLFINPMQRCSRSWSAFKKHVLLKTNFFSRCKLHYRRDLYHNFQNHTNFRHYLIRGFPL